MKNKFSILTLFTFLMIFSFSASSQTWKSFLELTGKGDWGNNNQMDLVSSGGVKRADTTMELSFGYKVLYSEKSAIINKEEYRANLKFDWKPKHMISPFLLFIAEQKKLKNINLRLSSLAGAKWVYFKSEEKGSEYSLSAALTYDMDEYIIENENSTTYEQKDITRLSLRPKFKQKLFEGKSKFTWMFFYLPKIDDFDDYRLNSIMSFTTKLTKNLALKIAYTMEYVNKPPVEGTYKKDDLLTLGLKLSF